MSCLRRCVDKICGGEEWDYLKSAPKLTKREKRFIKKVWTTADNQCWFEEADGGSFLINSIRTNLNKTSLKTNFIPELHTAIDAKRKCDLFNSEGASQSCAKSLVSGAAQSKIYSVHQQSVKSSVKQQSVKSSVKQESVKESVKSSTLGTAYSNKSRWSDVKSLVSGAAQSEIYSVHQQSVKSSVKQHSVKSSVKQESVKESVKSSKLGTAYSNKSRNSNVKSLISGVAQSEIYSVNQQSVKTSVKQHSDKSSVKQESVKESIKSSKPATSYLNKNRNSNTHLASSPHAEQQVSHGIMARMSTRMSTFVTGAEVDSPLKKMQENISFLEHTDQTIKIIVRFVDEIDKDDAKLFDKIRECRMLHLGLEDTGIQPKHYKMLLKAIYAALGDLYVPEKRIMDLFTSKKKMNKKYRKAILKFFKVIYFLMVNEDLESGLRRQRKSPLGSLRQSLKRHK